MIEIHNIKLEEKTVDENGNIIEKDLNEKANRVQALVDSFAADLKYEGETPRILIGDLPPGVEAFASPENNTIAIDRKVLALADANKVLTLVGHELGHFNSYDAKTESTAKRVEDAIQGTKNKGKYTEKLEKEFQEKYAGRDISGSEAQKVIDGIPEKNKENSTYGFNVGVGAGLLAKIGLGGSYYTTIDYKNNKVTVFSTADGSLEFTTPNSGISMGFSIYPNVTDPNVLEGRAQNIGVGFPIPRFEELGVGVDLIYTVEGKWIGAKFSIGPSVLSHDAHGGFTSGAKIIKRQEYTISEYYKKVKPRGGRNKW
ncbi:M48 family metalloprotease [Fusobacterium ulcerans]|uniref:M48 family metalloprotease n=1 Tax=Fusobacterium ulcerans TaxID=861 RepID=UPI00103026E9